MLPLIETKFKQKFIQNLVIFRQNSYENLNKLGKNSDETRMKLGQTLQYYFVWVSSEFSSEFI